MSFDSHSRSNPVSPQQRRAASPKPRRRLGRWSLTSMAVAVVAVAMLAAGCSTGPGSQEEFEQILLEGGSLSESEASCIAQGVFDEYEEDEEALGKISAAPDFAYLSTEEGVDGFEAFFDQTVAGCTTEGPTP